MSNAWDSKNPLSHSASIPAVFHSQKLWGLLFPHWNPVLEGLVWGWVPLLLRRDPCSQNTPPDFDHRVWGGASLLGISVPPTRLSVASLYP